MYRCLLGALALLLAAAGGVRAYNDAVAIAVPLEGISVDGELSDWPADLPVYFIRENTDAYGPTDLSGTLLDTSADFSPRFRVGYSAKERLIYVALEARDDSLAEGDGCELYLHALQDMEEDPFQFLRDYDDEEAEVHKGLGWRNLFGGRNFVESGSQSAVGRVGDVTVYEWALAPLGETLEERVELRPGLRLGFDVVALDEDREDDTQAWVAWSPQPYKLRDARLLGNLVLAADATQPALVNGVVHGADGMPVDGIKVRVESADGAWGDAVLTGADGRYTAWTLPGRYRLSVAARGDTTAVVVEAGARQTADLSAPHFDAANRPIVVAPPPGEEQEVSLLRGARYRVGDDLVWSAADFDDGEWPKARSGEEEIEADEEARVIWFRYKLSVDPAWRRVPLVLSRGSEANSVDFFLNGEKLPTFRLEERDNRTVLVFDRDGPNLLAVRYAFRQDGELAEQMWEYDLSLQPAVLHLEGLVKDIRLESTGFSLFIGVPLVFTMLHLLLFSFYPRRQEHLFYGLFTAGIAAVALLFAGSGLLRQWLEPWIFGMIVFGLFFLMGWAVLRFLYALFYDGLPKVFWVFTGAALNLTGGLVILSFSIFGKDYRLLTPPAILLTGGALWLLGRWRRPWPRALWWSWGLFLLPAYGLAIHPALEDLQPFLALFLGLGILVEVVRVLFVALRRRTFGAVTVSAGVLVFLASLGGLFVQAVRETSDFPLAIFATGVFGLLAAMSVHLARSVGRTSRDLEEQLVQVETLSARNLEQERALRVRMEQELEEARQLQLSMLPQEKPATPHLEIAWHMATATEVGGDYYDYSLAEDDTLTLALGDATGHGIQAGTLVTATKSLFQTLASNPDIVEIFAVMSRSLWSMNLKRMGMAMTILKIRGSRLQISAAGIPPMFLYRTASGTVEEVVQEGVPLGLLEASQYQQKEFSLEPEDTLLLMSDGFPERLNGQDEELGYPRALEHFAEVAERPSEEIVRHLVRSGEAWAAGRPQDDDVTFVVLKVKS